MTSEFACELEARKLWALRRLGGLIDRGKRSGWIDGDFCDLERLEQPLLDHGDTPMSLLQRRLRLEDSELDALWLLACAELEPLISRAAAVLASPGMHEINAQTLESLLERGAESVSKLDQLGLIEIGGDARAPLYRRPVRPNDRVLDLARGTVGLDRKLRGLARISNPSGRTNPIPLEIDRAITSGVDVLIVARGASGSGRAALLVDAAHHCGMQVLRVDTALLAAEPTLERCIRELSREALLHEAVLMLESVELLTDRHAEVERGLSSFSGPVFMTTTRGGGWEGRRTVLAIDVAVPCEESRAEMWRRELPRVAEDVVVYAARYRIGPELIQQTARVATVRARSEDRLVASDIRESLGAQLERRFGRLARRIETKQTWNDLVLPVDQLELLLELVARVKHRNLVLDEWGFGSKVGRGLGLAALLSGPPGTGKTMIGGLLARELELDLYQVDLSQVVSKYIGETEKQLGAVFDAAEAGNAILLFDEADSLFGKRTEVKSSNDRYANLEVNYLLQRIEAFEGICLMTTNHEHGIDPAFQRRLAAHIRVPMPDREQRERIWRAMIPAAADVASDLDFHGVAELRMSGGYIKNAVLRSAFLAAANNSRITSEFLWKSARLEYEASGKLMREAV